MHSAKIFMRILLFYSTASHLARASATLPQNSTRQWGFAEVCVYLKMFEVIQLMILMFRFLLQRALINGILVLMISYVRSLM